MKHLIHATTLAFGLICTGAVSAAQDETTNMRDVTVHAVPGQYETYSAELQTGYALHALVGNTHRQYVQARRAADESESLRKRGNFVPVAVAIDNASGPGIARQIQLIDAARNTVAIVNVYCKRVMPSGGARCRLHPLPMSINRDGQSLASTRSAYLQIAQVDLRD
jgi:hypothetical protein